MIISPALIGFIALVILAIVVVFFVLFSLRSKSRLPVSVRKRVQHEWNIAVALPDPLQRVLKAEAVVDKLLQDAGYSGSFAEKLKASKGRFPHEQAIWSAHKLRNRLAHEPGSTVSDAQATSAVRAFEQIIKHFRL